MRVLLTGANGFIGRNVIERMSGSHELITLDREGDGLDIVHDLTKALTWVPDAPIDAVIHLAAESGVRSFGQASFENNVQSTATILDWATQNNVRVVLYSSSSSVYGNQLLMDETSPVMPISPYGQSKFACERLLSAWARRENRIGLTLRLFNAIGKHQRKTMFPAMICDHLKAVESKQQSELVLFGSRLRSWTHVGDIVNGFWDALRTFADAKLGTYLVLNLGTSAMMTQRDLITLFVERSGVSPNLVMGEPNQLDVQRTKADMARFTSMFGWFPDPRNVAVGVEEILREYGLM